MNSYGIRPSKISFFSVLVILLILFSNWPTFLFAEILITQDRLDSCFYYFSAIQKSDGQLGSSLFPVNWEEQVLGSFVFLLRADFYRAKKVLRYLEQELKRNGDLDYSPEREEAESENINIRPDPNLSEKLWYIIAAGKYFKITGDRTFLKGAETLGYKLQQYLLPNGGLVSFDRQNNPRLDFRDNLLAMISFANLGEYNRYFYSLSSRVRYFITHYFDPAKFRPDEQLWAGLAGIKPPDTEQIRNLSSLSITGRSILATLSQKKEDIESLSKNLVIDRNYPGSLGLSEDSQQISLTATAFYIFASKNFNPLATEKMPESDQSRLEWSEKFTGDDFEMWPWQLALLWQFSGQNCQVDIKQESSQHHSGRYSLGIDFIATGPAANARIWRQFLFAQDFSGYQSISVWIKGQRISGTIQLFLVNEQGQEFLSKPLIPGGSNGLVNTITLADGLQLSPEVKNLALRKVKQIGVKITSNEVAATNIAQKIYLDNLILK